MGSRGLVGPEYGDTSLGVEAAHAAALPFRFEAAYAWQLFLSNVQGPPSTRCQPFTRLSVASLVALALADTHDGARRLAASASR